MMWWIQQCGDAVHVFPENDDRHVLEMDCWCTPEVEVEKVGEGSLVMHRDKLDRLELV